jgi:hypothetical protein
MLFLAIIIVLLTTLLITSLLRISSIVPRLLAIFLIAVAQIVLVGEIAGLTGLMNNQFFYLIFHLLSLAVSIGFWIKYHTPSVFPISELKGQVASLRSLPDLIRKYPDLFIFSAAILIAYLVNAVLILVVPPNTNDSMTTHMARIGFWLQNGSLRSWSTPYIFQLIYPINAQLQILWTILFRGSDQFAGFVQWFACIFAGIAIYGIARLIKCGKAASLFAVLVWASFPQIILQSSSTQNDLAVAAFSVVGIYFIFKNTRSRDEIDIWLSGLSFGLAAGTKQTWFFLIPGLVLIGIVLILKQNDYIKNVIRWGMATAVCALIFGSVIYIKNWMDYRNPFGPPEVVAGDTTSSSITSQLVKITYNPARHFYQFIDPGGLPSSVADKITTIKKSIYKPFSEAIDLPLDAPVGLYIDKNPFDYEMSTDIQEDTSWFGPLSVIVLLSAFCYQFVLGIKKKDALIVGLIFLGFSFFCLVSILRRGWSPYQGRYFVISITILAPLMASLFSNRLGGKLYRYLAALVGIVVIFYTTFKNPAKPFIRDYWTFNQGLSSEFQQRGLAGVMKQFSDIFTDPTSIFQLSRQEKFALQGTLMRAPLTLADNHMKSGDTLGLLGPDGTWHYPFFGDAFEFRLVLIYPQNSLFSNDWLTEQGVDWVLVSHDSIPKSKIPGNLELVEELKSWGIYHLTENLLPQ